MGCLTELYVHKPAITAIAQVRESKSQAARNQKPKDLVKLEETKRQGIYPQVLKQLDFYTS